MHTYRYMRACILFCALLSVSGLAWSNNMRLSVKNVVTDPEMVELLQTESPYLLGIADWHTLSLRIEGDVEVELCSAGYGKTIESLRKGYERLLEQAKEEDLLVVVNVATTRRCNDRLMLVIPVF
jgi:hypothetical protein